MTVRRGLLWKDIALISFWLTAFIGTHLPQVPQAINQVSDKTLHSAAFTILGGLLSWVLQDRVRGWNRHGLLVLLIIAAYGAADELLQIPVGRHCDFQDWVADMIGGCTGLALFHVVHRLARIFRTSTAD